LPLPVGPRTSTLTSRRAARSTTWKIRFIPGSRVHMP
jgi:hypothetical protein